MSATLTTDDLYERLGIPREATGDEVKRAYRGLVRVYPPERAPEEFKRIREAYETLSDARSRQEYDTAPSPALQRLMHAAAQAMSDQDYPEAERNLKQILVQDPTLDYVRNMLGMCFVYQGKAEEAVAQYERLLSAPEPSPAWLGNAGHAYQAAGRYYEAEHAFRRAIHAAGEDDVGIYQLGLADVYVSMSALPRAVKLLEDAIRSDGKVDFDDLLFFTKLVEVHLRANDLRAVQAVVGRIRAIAFDDEQRRYAAWKLGSLGRSLLESGAFVFAQVVAQGAAAIEPGDADYPALASVAHCLETYDYQGAVRLVDEHLSFKGDQWLAGLAVGVRQFCAERHLLHGMKPIESAPTLFTLNGVGTNMYGERDYDRFTRSYVATVYFVILFIPIIPISCYRVIRHQGGGWNFIGKVDWSNRERYHLWAVLAAIGILFLYGMIAG